MIRPIKVGHVVLKVRNLAEVETFYTDVLGFDVVNRLDRPHMVFLTLGVQHHDLALLEVPPDADAPIEHQVGLHHVALQLSDSAAVSDAFHRLRARGVAILRAVDHGTTHSVYFADPAGNRIELYCDIGEDGLDRARRRTVRAVEEFPTLDFAQRR